LRVKDLRRSLRYYLVAVPLIAVLSRLPLGAARSLGALAGTLAWLFARTSRRRAMENLRQVYGGEKSPRDLRRICRGVFRNTALNVCELLVVYRWPAEKIRRRFPLAEEFRGIDEALRGGGTVGLTAHFGNWELLGVLCGVYLPGRVWPVAKRIYFEKFQVLVERFRRRMGLDVIYTDEPPRRMVEALRAGKILVMLPDQNLKAVSGVFVEFFGRPAYTSTAPVHLALATDSKLAAGYLVRDGGRFRILFHQIPLDRSGSREEAILENTRRWTRLLEEEIRARPDQWVWFHRRWRRRPEDGSRTIGRRRQRRPPAFSVGAGADEVPAPAAPPLEPGG
jgi:KDO2-lipid IV(A) lauroyltransferase